MSDALLVIWCVVWTAVAFVAWNDDYDVPDTWIVRAWRDIVDGFESAIDWATRACRGLTDTRR